jgi:hypothetical protein
MSSYRIDMTSCGCVYVIQKPTTGSGGSQTLAYNTSTKDLTISGGNTVTITEKQQLNYSSGNNDLAISDGISGVVNTVNIPQNQTLSFDVASGTLSIDNGLSPGTTVSSVNIIPVTTGNFAYFSWRKDENNLVTCEIDTDWNGGTALSTATNGNFYFIVPGITKFINCIFTGQYTTDYALGLTGAKNKGSVAGQLVKASSTSTGAASYINSFISFRVLDDTLVYNRVLYDNAYAPNVVTGNSGSFNGTLFNTFTLGGNSVSNMYFQYKFVANTQNFSNYAVVKNRTTGSILATSATYTSPGTDFYGYAYIWRNTVLEVTSGYSAGDDIEFWVYATVPGVTGFTFNQSSLLAMYEEYP